MRFVLITFFTLFISFTCSAQTSIADLQPEEYFDFWVGEWDLSWELENGGEGFGTNHVHKTLDETVIQENFEAFQGSYEGFKGKSFSVYNPGKQSWYQTWVDNEGGYIDLEGRVEGERRIFQTDARITAQGDTIMNRMVFYDIEPNSFTWDWEYSMDEGESWTLSWRIYYQRMNQ